MMKIGYNALFTKLLGILTCTINPDEYRTLNKEYRISNFPSILIHSRTSFMKINK